MYVVKNDIHNFYLTIKMFIRNLTIYGCNDIILLQQVYVVTQTRSRFELKSNEDNPVRIK